MPAPIWLAHRLSERLTKVRKDGLLTDLRPDGKTQVTLGYDSNNVPVSVDTVVVSSQHTASYDLADLRADIEKHVIAPVLGSVELDSSNAKFIVLSLIHICTRIVAKSRQAAFCEGVRRTSSG